MSDKPLNAIQRYNAAQPRSYTDDQVAEIVHGWSQLVEAQNGLHIWFFVLGFVLALGLWPVWKVIL